MKKPISKWALGLWIMAVIYVVGAAIYVFKLPLPAGTELFDIVWLFFRGAALWATLLAAFGALIELVDQIRWKMLSEEERSAAQSKPSLWSKLRRWPHKDSA